MMLRLGAAVVMPALIVTGAFVALRDDPPPARTVTETPDGDSGLTTRNPTGPPVPSPSASPSPDAPSAQPRETTSPDQTAPPDDPSETSPSEDPPRSDPPDEPPDQPPSDEPTASPEPIPPARLGEDEADLWREIRDDRENTRCPALKVNSALITAARARSADPDGASATRQAARAGYDGEVTENVADGFSDPGITMFQLGMNGMDDNVENCAFDAIGIGLDDSDGPQWTVIFGAS